MPATAGGSLSVLHPLQRALLPDPDVAHNQDAEENEHLHQAKHSQGFELHRPGKQKNGLDVENYKKDGNDVVANRIATPRPVYRIDAALIRKQLGTMRVLRTNQFGNQQGDGNQRPHDCYKQEHRHVVLRHCSPDATSLAPRMAYGQGMVQPLSSAFKDFASHKLVISVPGKGSPTGPGQTSCL